MNYNKCRNCFDFLQTNLSDISSVTFFRNGHFPESATDYIQTCFSSNRSFRMQPGCYSTFSGSTHGKTSTFVADNNKPKTMETNQHQHSHGHAHHHHHHHHAVPTTLSGIFITCIILNLLFVAVEAGAGLYTNSLGLLSDAGHNLSDVFSLLLSLFAIRMAMHRSNRHFTYGYKKSTILVSLVNAIILLVAVGAILIESVYKLRHPEPVSGEVISWVAGAGILVNGLTAWLLMKKQGNDLNVKGAYLHMAMDTLVSVGVVISGLIISYTGWEWIDPVIGLCIAFIILVSTWNLLKESLFLTLDGVPESIDMQEVEATINGVPGIESWHHLHVWAVSTTENAATLHIVLKDLEELESVTHTLKHALREKGIHHSTIECERTGHTCGEEGCCGCNGEK